MSLATAQAFACTLMTSIVLFRTELGRLRRPADSGSTTALQQLSSHT